MNTCLAASGALGAALFTLATGCAPMSSASYVRDADVRGLDAPALSTGLDRRDLDRVFEGQIRDLLDSPFMVVQRQHTPAATVAVVPIRNETTEHLEGQLDALLGKVETALVRAQTLRVVSLENHPDLVAEIRAEQDPVYDRQTAARYGKLLGVRYVVTGKVFDKAERVSDMRRVQYFLFLQVLGVEDGEVVWQRESAVTKALVAGY